MSYIVTGSQLRVEDLVDVARHGKEVALHPEAVARIHKCRQMLEQKIAAHEIRTKAGQSENKEIGDFYRRHHFFDS